jgi:superfamily II DNA or RNA helicase
MSSVPIQSLHRVLTAKGYAITKTSLTDAQTKSLKKELTVSPKVLDKFKWAATSFPIYSESKTRFYVPRQWGIKIYGEPEASVVPQGLPFSSGVEWNGAYSPHDFQTEIIEQFIRRGGNGLICVPCGYGKTFMALRIAMELGLRTLIVVDKEFLMNQWKSEIERFMIGTNGRVGILQANVIQTDATRYDITICMIQTVCKREFPEAFFDQYGFTIFDECHHLGASYFCKALQRIQTRYMLGLSATPDREDGLSRVFEAFLGEAVYKKTQRDPDSEAVVKAVWYHSEDPAYSEIPLNMRGEVVTAKLLNQVAEYEPRNQRILQLIQEYSQDSRRYLLLLSDRISQLEWFHTAIQETLPKTFSVGYYIGGMKQAVLDHNAEHCHLLLATYQMASEAFSVKKLNTVILSTPRKNVQQSTGRIFRERMDERKVPPHIIDVIDSHDCHKRRWMVRQRFYKECKYTIQHMDRPGSKKSGKSQKSSEDEDEKEEKETPCLITFAIAS